MYTNKHEHIGEHKQSQTENGSVSVLLLIVCDVGYDDDGDDDNNAFCLLIITMK